MRISPKSVRNSQGGTDQGHDEFYPVDRQHGSLHATQPRLEHMMKMAVSGADMLRTLDLAATDREDGIDDRNTEDQKARQYEMGLPLFTKHEDDDDAAVAQQK